MNSMDIKAEGSAVGPDAGPGAARARLNSIDVVRGVIMVVMALDHTREFFGVPGRNPTDLATASAVLFFTRWITHFCAPVFFLLTGTSAYLSRRRRSPEVLSRFLFTRGLWLIVLELTVVRCFAYQFNTDYRVTMLIVLWTLGWAMISLSLLVHLPMAVITGFGVALIAGHNLLDAVRSSNPLWLLLHGQGIVLNTPEHLVFVAYPLIPWIAVTAVGYGLGPFYDWEPERRRRWLLQVGIALTAAFILVRGLNVYGDPSPWRAHGTTLFTALAFLNTTKQPPSLLFLLMTLGPSLLLLWSVDRATPRLLRPALVIGKVPLFYYVLHFSLIHLLTVATAYARYGSAHWMFESPDLAHYPFTPPPGWGYSLPVVYVIWVLVVAVMYPLCRWFAALKRRRSDPWLRYL